jgi:molybdopterin biosynthesis enzyme
MVHNLPMTTVQRLPHSLTPLEAALAMLRDGLAPVAPRDMPLAEALGCVAAETPALAAVPARDVAVVDGFAFRARDLVGASSYSPLPLARPPPWVEAGDAMPGGCDCVVDADRVQWSGPLAEVVAEAIPGQGVRRAGEDIAKASSAIVAGKPLGALDLLLARAAGLKTLAVRRPRLHVINIPVAAAANATAQLIADLAGAAGAAVTSCDARGRDAASIARALDAAAGDVMITVGGTGVGRSDAAVQALAIRGGLLAHGLALAPGRTTAIGRMAAIPVIALPGAPDQALAAWWTLALPVLDRLSARQPRPALRLPLARKIASGIGVAEIALVRQIDGSWMPLASSDLSLDSIAGADGWFAISAASEGFAAGTPVDAYMLRD